MKDRTKKKMYNRILICVLAITVAFIVIVGKLVFVQVVNAHELAEKQTSYMFSNITLTASRGIIYDRDMNILAQDASCSKVYVFPNSIEDAEGVSVYLSEKLGLSYDEIYAKISDKSNKYVVIKSKVDNQTALEISQQGFPGVGTADDQKRYYTDANFAQYILGFTGTDHNGLYGIEAVFNDVLSGEDGVKTVLTDSESRIIESSSMVKKEAQKGNSVVLTLDSVVQYYAESAAYEAYLKYSPKRVMVIVSDVSNNDILAMAGYPSYSLEDPWTVSADYHSSYCQSMGSLSEQQLSMWSNPFTSFIYEPGSTFKVITSSSALEEHVVNIDSQFYCGGSIIVSGVQIGCHIYPNGHGSENLIDAMANSCNPALVQIANYMGADNFYRYIYSYGFGDKTGIALDGEESGILSSNQNVNPVNFATLSFGQGLGVTPVQMLQALNAAINGGYLRTPRVVSQVLDSDSGEVVYEYEPQIVRQVISEETSETMRSILAEVGNRMSVLSDYSQYKILGKTGTAQKYIDGAYASGRYVTSFFGAVPYDNPQISVLVILDEPGGYSTFGSTTAAPVGAKVLANAYDYLSAKDKITIDSITNSGMVVPDVRGQKIEDALSILNSLGIAYSQSGDKSGTVTNQNLISAEYMEGMVVELTVSDLENESGVIVPNVLGMSVQKVNELLTEAGLVLDAQGGGISISQNISYGTTVERGTIITVKFEYIE